MPESVIVLSPNNPIDHDVLKEFLEQLAIAESIDQPIQIRICSSGGDSTVAMAMYDAIRACRNKVTTVALGNVGSAAVLVFAAGDARLIGKNAVLYLHKLTISASGDQKEMDTMLGEYNRLKGSYCSLIGTRAGIDPDTIDEMCKSEGFVSPETALKLGIATGYLERPKRKRKP